MELRQGETISKRYPSVGRVPFTAKTSAGRVDIVEFWASGPPEVGPEFESRPGGKLYPLPEPSGIRDASDGEYLFRPDSKQGLPVTVHFLTRAGLPAWSPRDYDDVLKRVTFGAPDPKDCKPPVGSPTPVN